MSYYRRSAVKKTYTLSYPNSMYIDSNITNFINSYVKTCSKHQGINEKPTAELHQDSTVCSEGWPVTKKDKK